MLPPCLQNLVSQVAAPDCNVLRKEKGNGGLEGLGTVSAARTHETPSYVRAVGVLPSCPAFGNWVRTAAPVRVGLRVSVPQDGAILLLAAWGQALDVWG